MNVAATEVDALVALHQRLHHVSVTLASTELPVEDVVDMLLGVLDQAAPVLPVLGTLAPGVLATLAQLDKVGDVPVLTGELAEAHRLLGHALRDRGVDPGRPATTVGDVVHEALAGHRIGAVGNGKPLPATDLSGDAG